MTRPPFLLAHVLGGEAERLRAGLAALLGLQLAGCPSPSIRRDDPEPAVAVVPTAAPPDEPGASGPDFATPPGGDDGAPPDEARVREPAGGETGAAGDAGPRADSGRPGWKSAEGAFCVAEVDTVRQGPGCGRASRKLFAIPDQPSGMHGFALAEDATERERRRVPDACCYGVTRPMRGRPLRRSDPERSLALAPFLDASTWASSFSLDEGALDVLDEATRRSAAEAWAHDAALEHASVAEFARVALALLALGAPAELVADAHRAALDEVRHAELAFGVASALAGRPLAPGPLDLGPSLALGADRVALARETIEDGCVGECLAALEARVASLATPEPDLGRALAEVAEDEARHAELAYRIVAWTLETGDAEEVRAIGGLLADAARTLRASLEADAKLPSSTASERAAVVGHLDAVQLELVRRQGLEVAVLPALEALAARARGARGHQGA